MKARFPRPDPLGRTEWEVRRWNAWAWVCNFHGEHRAVIWTWAMILALIVGMWIDKL